MDGGKSKNVRSVNALSRFEAWAAASPDAIAVVHNSVAWTYGALNSRSNQLAHALIVCGVQPEVLVSLSARRTPELILGWLAIHKAGGAVLPLGLDYPPERLAFLMRESGSGVVLADSLTRPVIEQAVASMDAATFTLLDFDTGHGENIDNPTVAVSLDHLAYVMYTSGSTGAPKGVEIERRSLCSVVDWYGYSHPLTPNDRVLQAANPTFDSLIFEIFYPLSWGASIHIADDDVRADGISLYRWMVRNRITILGSVPMFTEAFFPIGEAEQWAGCTLRFVAVGGDKMHRGAPAGAPFRYVNCYGPTENTVEATWYDVPQVRPGEQDQPPPSIGFPIRNVQVYLLDESQQPTAEGEIGELYLGGIQVARGYRNRPDLTAERFIPDPYSDVPGARLYRTGDLARLTPDGYAFLGRADDQVKIRGVRIEIGEVEAALYRLPEIQDAAVNVQSRLRDGDDKYLAAFIVWTDRAMSDQSDRIERLRERLLDMLPPHLIPTVFVTLDALPLNANGKLDRRALPPPPPRSEEFTRPRTGTESRLAALWVEILPSNPANSFSIHDDFFAVGGNSLHAARLMTRVEAEFGQRLALSSLYRHNTIEKLGLLITPTAIASPDSPALDSATITGWSSLVPIQTHGSRPTFFCVHGIGGNIVAFQPLSATLGDDQPLYGLQARGLDGNQRAHTRVEDMAALYITEIQTVQPHGPYYLGGQSFGGVIAYEMARQLTASGETVVLVALFDSFLYNVKTPPLHGLLTRVTDGAARARLHLRALFRLPTAHKVRYVRKRLSKLAERHQLSNWRRQYRRQVSLELPDSILPPHLRSVKKACLLAAQQYVPQPYAGHVTLFRAEERDPILSTSQYAWRKLAPNTAFVDVPGSHANMMNAPHVHVLAQRLRQAIDANTPALAAVGRVIDSVTPSASASTDHAVGAAVNRDAAEIERLTMLHLTLQRGCFVERTVDLDGAVYALARGIRSPYWNYASRVNTTSADSGALIDRVSAFARAHGRSPAFDLTHDTQPGDFSARLIERGFRQIADMAWLVRDTTHDGQGAIESGVRSQQPVTIVAASSSADLAEVENIYHVCFAPDDAEELIGWTQWHDSNDSDRVEVLHLLAVAEDGTPCGAASLYRVHGAAGIYNVGVLPAFRQAGVARAMLIDLIARSRRHGDAFVTLQATVGSPALHLYEQLGFSVRFLSTLYVLPW